MPSRDPLGTPRPIGYLCAGRSPGWQLDRGRRLPGMIQWRNGGRSLRHSCGGSSGFRRSAPSPDSLFVAFSRTNARGICCAGLILIVNIWCLPFTSGPAQEETERNRGGSCDNASRRFGRIAPANCSAPKSVRQGQCRTNPKPVESYLMDMDGVIIRENHIVPGADRFIERLRETGKGFLILTNNSRHTPRDLAAHLRRLGLDVTDGDIWTSALATARFLSDQRPEGSAFVIGESGLTTALYEAGVHADGT